MEYVYAAMLLHKADKDITEDNVSDVLDASGIDVDENQVKALIAALEDVDIEDAIESAVISAGSGGAAPAPSSDDSGSDDEDQAEDEAEDDEEDDVDDEEAAEGLDNLF